jgi:hypothetical protein
MYLFLHLWLHAGAVSGYAYASNRTGNPYGGPVVGGGTYGVQSVPGASTSPFGHSTSTAGGAVPPAYGSYGGARPGETTGFAANRSAGTPGGSWGALPPAPAPAPPGYGGRGPTLGPGGATGRVGGATRDGVYERSMIEELTAPGGLRPGKQLCHMLTLCAGN